MTTLALFVLVALCSAFFVQGFMFRQTVERIGERLHTTLKEQRQMTLSIFKIVADKLDVDTTNEQSFFNPGD